MTRSAGYVFGRYKFFGKKVILSIFLASISIPLVSTLIPVYEVVKSMGLVGTRLGLILSGAGGAHVIFLLLFSSYYQQIPKELEEAAHMDGCGFYRTYSDIMKPMSTPISMTVIIMETIWTWNAFLLPLVLTLNNPSSRTLAVGLYAFRGENTIDWTGIAAGATISVIPIIILFICLQKYVVEGVSGAVKS
jgi:raffinose/stachyose/melibiose transport system permease protein